MVLGVLGEVDVGNHPKRRTEWQVWPFIHARVGTRTAALRERERVVNPELVRVSSHEEPQLLANVVAEGRPADVRVVSVELLCGPSLATVQRGVPRVEPRVTTAIVVVARTRVGDHRVVQPVEVGRRPRVPRGRVGV